MFVFIVAPHFTSWPPAVVPDHSTNSIMSWPPAVVPDQSINSANQSTIKQSSNHNIPCCHVHSNHSTSTHHPYMHLDNQSINSHVHINSDSTGVGGWVKIPPCVSLVLLFGAMPAGVLFLSPTWPALKQQNCEFYFPVPGSEKPIYKPAGYKSRYILFTVISTVY